jgi:peptide deformylase
MILPIVAYGDPVLKKRAAEISKNMSKLPKIIEDMYDTMYHSKGVGLAAPQVGLSIRLFVTDGKPFDEDEVRDFKQVFINPVIREEEGALWKFNECCLSIPHIRDDIQRKKIIHIDFFDEDWNKRSETYSGLSARIIQHEYDHLEGILFTDRISPLRRRLLKNRLADIS